ncbi:MAG: hypothetical protein M2R45_00013 [Verrucomicrobia subdivision 3 bacterium]|nr:hypothetical protein [Limisphaerales bacterium]MCS1412528.1 hypothetical protein [Limisphaerales bacterium]
MKTFLATLLGVFFAAVQTLGQVTIRSADMFSEVGQYYRAYVNYQGGGRFLTPQPIPIRDKVGEPGGPHLWDFTTGPTDETIRVDYVNPERTVQGFNFPNIKLAERKTNESNGDTRWLFIEQTPLVGRKVFGFFELKFGTQSHAFEPPIIDFPDPIQFGDKWFTSVTYQTAIPEAGFDFPIRFTIDSEFEVDAYGFIDLPGLGFGDVLRVNEKVTHTQAIESDIFGGGLTGDPEIDGEIGGGNGTFTDVAKLITRNLYFLRPGYGIVAQIHSAVAKADPGARFQEANYFSRMFETNKTLPEPCTEPAAVDDLEISFGSGRALLKWSTSECTDFYSVEYSSLGGIEGSWKSLGETQNNFMVDELAVEPVRLYRVISRKGTPPLSPTIIR